MTEFLIGAGTSLSVVCFAAICYLAGRQHAKKWKGNPPLELDEDEKKKQQQLLKDFNAVMNYNEKKAYERRIDL